ncbi:MAG: N-6 DNA methylase [Planctomycetes bacterium]|nr:N-6 DNA methylase [Planctomycetota bacterium]
MTPDLPSRLASAWSLARQALTRTRVAKALRGLPAGQRGLLVDAAGSEGAALETLTAHAAEALVAEAFLRAHGGEAWCAATRDDPAARVWGAVSGVARLGRELQAAVADLPLPPAAEVAARLFPRASPERATKRRGGVYTPPALVGLLLDLLDAPAGATILEPAAGDGAFLRALWDRRGTGATSVGLERHPYAWRAGWTALAVQGLARGQGPEQAPRWECVDALEHEPCPRPWGVVGNPPWVRAERLPAALRATLRERFPELRGGNLDLSAYFLRRALDWVEPGGRVAFVLPQGLLESRAAQGLRAALAEHTVEAVLSLEWAPQVFAGALVIPCLVSVTRAPPASRHAVRLGACQPGQAFPTGVRWSEVPQARWLGLQPRGPWPTLVRKPDLSVLGALARAPRPLDASYGLAIRTRAKAGDLIAEDPERLGSPRRLLDGREVRTFKLDWSGRWLDYDPARISDPKPASFFRAPQVLCARIALAPQAAVDPGPEAFLARNTVMVVRAPGTALEGAPYALAALINSLPLRVFALLVLRAGVLASSHRATWYAGSLGALPIPRAVLEDAPPRAALERLGKRAHVLAARGAAVELAALEAELSERVAAAFELSPAQARQLRKVAAHPTVAPLLSPVEPGAPTRAIQAQSYTPGERYA